MMNSGRKIKFQKTRQFQGDCQRMLAVYPVLKVTRKQQQENTSARTTPPTEPLNFLEV